MNLLRICLAILLGFFLGAVVYNPRPVKANSATVTITLAPTPSSMGSPPFKLEMVRSSASHVTPLIVTSCQDRGNLRAVWRVGWTGLESTRLRLVYRREGVR